MAYRKISDYMPYHLSKAEMHILQLLALGYSFQHICDTCFISRTTLKTHVSSITLKMLGRKKKTDDNATRLSRIVVMFLQDYNLVSPKYYIDLNKDWEPVEP